MPLIVHWNLLNTSNNKDIDIIIYPLIGVIKRRDHGLDQFIKRCAFKFH